MGGLILMPYYLTKIQQCNQLIIDFARFMEGDQTPMTPMTARKRACLEDFTIQHRLGKGAYGDVFLVLKKSDGKQYALKQIQKRKLEREQKEYQAFIQRQLLSNFKHSGIVKLRYSFQDKTSLYFVQEFCEGGEFINFIKANIDKMSQQAKVFYIGQMVNLIEYLHGIGVTHRDLKPENLMMDKRGHLKLIDFGTAEISECTILKPGFRENIIKQKKKLEETEPEKMSSEEEIQEPAEMDSPLKKRRSTFVGTCYYISPELLEENYCPPSADLWALGCIIYQMYYLETPFKDSYEFAVFEKIKLAEYSFPKNQSITEDAIDLIKKLLVKNPMERLGSGTTEELSFKKLKSHPFFKGLDIDNIFKLPVPFQPDSANQEKNQSEKKQFSAKFDIFKQKIEGTVQYLVEEQEKQITKKQIMEEKSFVNSTLIFLALCQDGDLYFVNSEQFQKIQLITLKKTDNVYSKLQNNKCFVIYQAERAIELISQSAEEWVKAINNLP